MPDALNPKKLRFSALKSQIVAVKRDRRRIATAGQWFEIAIMNALTVQI